MRWDELEAAVTAVLRIMERFPQPVDAETLVNYANENDPAWRLRSAAVVVHYQALVVIDLLELAWSPDGANRQINEAGRSYLAVRAAGSQTALYEDPRLRDWAALTEARESFRGHQITEANTFSRLELSQWRQFSEVAIDFHPRLTVLTGANGAGKTTLLNVLAPHFSWAAQLVTSSARYRELGSGTHVARVGQLSYSNGVWTPIQEVLTEQTTVQPLQIPSQQPVPGIFISSHRSISGYQALQNLPAKFSTADALLTQFANEVQTRYSGGNSRYSPLYRMKEALVAAAMYAYGNAAVVANSEARDIWEGFQDVLAKLLPRALAFRRLVVEDGDVWVKTSSSQFPLEAVSGGVSAVVELGWQIFLRGRGADSFTVCIDEPENHLHPELQRTILPTLLEAFPLATYVVATHSPFVVTSSRDSLVYALRNDEHGRVRSRQVRDINSSATSDETLMSVLGLDTPLPQWAEVELQRALTAVPDDPKADDLRLLRERLIAAGLGAQFPAAIDALRTDGSTL
ncbi:AAA family ATPase [Microbacterium sp. NPDC078428]|uniref:AAA family ATPase n=1 Tax=Microbacterium sp. NPDC078428 TaxID=3364190 RepID=UPI0037C6621B